MQQVARIDQLAQLGCSEHALSGLHLPQSAYAYEGRRFLDNELAVYLWCRIPYDLGLSSSVRDMMACRGFGTTTVHPLVDWSTPRPLFRLNWPIDRYFLQVDLQF
jgi:hypothetical protein